jgi:hypothetical protein
VVAAVSGVNYSIVSYILLLCGVVAVVGEVVYFTTSLTSATRSKQMNKQQVRRLK